MFIGKVIIILLVGLMFYMIISGGCSSRQNFMPYLPTQNMCDMTPEYWPEECKGAPTTRENCCGGRQPTQPSIWRTPPDTVDVSPKIKESCCGMV